MIRYLFMVGLILALLACDVVAEPTRWPTSTPPLEQDASTDLASTGKDVQQAVEQPSLVTPTSSTT